MPSLIVDDFRINVAIHPFVQIFNIDVREYWFKEKYCNLHYNYYLVRMKKPPCTNKSIVTAVVRTTNEKTISHYFNVDSGSYLIIGPCVSMVDVLCYRTDDGKIHFEFAINKIVARHPIQTWILASK